MRSNEYRYCACRMLALAIKRSTSHLLQPAIFTLSTEMITEVNLSQGC